MLCAVAAFLAGYVELFLFRRYLFGDFNAQRPALLLAEDPLGFIRGELGYALAALAIAAAATIFARNVVLSSDQVAKVSLRCSLTLFCAISGALLLSLIIWYTAIAPT